MRIVRYLLNIIATIYVLFIFDIPAGIRQQS